eukprot:2795572-Pleurochrysis_carterae.AAC.4
MFYDISIQNVQHPVITELLEDPCVKICIGCVRDSKLCSFARPVVHEALREYPSGGEGHAQAWRRGGGSAGRRAKLPTAPGADLERAGSREGLNRRRRKGGRCHGLCRCGRGYRCAFFSRDHCILQLVHISAAGAAERAAMLFHSIMYS